MTCGATTEYMGRTGSSAYPDPAEREIENQE
jgi:hypothetical protein